MLDPDHYWLEDKSRPYATLLSVLDAYCNPEAGGEDPYQELIELARRTDEVEVMRTFKEELRRGLLGDLPPNDDLFEAACYDDGSDEAFLRRLWRDLYPDEPVPEPESD